ncbi:MAG: asparaginase domain-containing protein [Pseudomonadota bacterium]
MNEKIAIITTGGTIGSVIKGQTVGIGGVAQKLMDEIHLQCEQAGASYEIFAPINKNSEDLIPSDWALIAACIKSAHDKGYQRFVITHGTDTLAYSAGAIGLLHAMSGLRICFTGAFYSMDFDQTDASINLMAALACVLSDNVLPGVYVSFRENETNRAANIYRAMNMHPMAFDAVVFGSSYGAKVAYFSTSLGLVTDKERHAIDYPHLSIDGPIDGGRLDEEVAKILMISLYPGLDINLLKPSLDKCSAAIINAYHSGTVGTGEFLRKVSDMVQKTPVLVGAYPEKHISTPYDSTAKLIEAGAYVYADLQPHHLLIYLAIGRASGLSMDDVLTVLDKKRLVIS